MIENKRLFLITAPLATVSGYGVMARDIVRSVLRSFPHDTVNVISLPWGNCPTNALVEGKDDDLIASIIQPPFNITAQPDVHIHVGVPNEAFPQGKYNILATAGIETTMVSVPWIEGCNRMDLVLTTSTHSKHVFENTQANKVTPNGQVVGTMKVEKPIEVLPIGVDTSIFKTIGMSEIPASITTMMQAIQETFCYLFVGHWLPGNFGEDRKNVSALIKVFGETFKELPADKQPALVLKTSGGGFSIMDRYEIENKIKMLKASVGPTCPSIYLIHGDISPEEMNGLYNHPKIKAHVSFTHGEGQGLPLLEASMSNKPVIAPKWSGQLDFLTEKNSILLEGKLEKIPSGAVWENVIIAESEWFNVDFREASKMLAYSFKNYAGFKSRTDWLYQRNRQMFSTTEIQKKTKAILTQYLPVKPVFTQVKLPALMKV